MADTISLSPKSATSDQSVTNLLVEAKEGGLPITLSVNGSVCLVVQDEASYQQLLDLVDRLETIEAIQEGIASIDRGEEQPVEEFIQEMRQQYQIPQRT